MNAIARLALNGYPNAAGEPMVFPFDETTGIGAANELVLNPRKAVWLVAMVTDDPNAVIDLDMDRFLYAGNEVYPDGGQGSVGFVRVKNPSAFTLESLRSDANPWPIGMLANDELSVQMQYTNNGAAAVQWTGHVLGISMRVDTDDYKRLLDATKASIPG
jgi:hypothetical protein